MVKARDLPTTERFVKADDPIFAGKPTFFSVRRSTLQTETLIEKKEGLERHGQETDRTVQDRTR